MDVTEKERERREGRKKREKGRKERNGEENHGLTYPCLAGFFLCNKNISQLEPAQLLRSQSSSAMAALAVKSFLTRHTDIYG